jgi:outer membrane receptor for ferrienterochelin and colicins
MRVFLILFAIFYSALLQGQSARGRVMDADAKPLYGASVTWLYNGKGVITDSDGQFLLEQAPSTDLRFVVSHVGFLPDTASASQAFFFEIVLAYAQIETVEIRAKKPGVYISMLQPIKTEVITQAELKKSACCDLAGCFETQGTVHPQTTNVLTNSKELRILGLSGVYNQLLVEGLPMIQGATFTYGISSIPGAMVENIFVAKGANSVLQGFESISGQINVELKPATKADPLLVNIYANSFGERHLNAVTASPLGKSKKWHTLGALHLIRPAAKIDRDEDQLLDLPQLRRIGWTHHFSYGDPSASGWSSITGYRMLSEKRVGGQTFFNEASDRGSTLAYGQTVRIDQPELFTKTSFRFNDRSRLALHAFAYLHNQESWFGITQYKAEQHSFYSNMQYEQRWGSNHDFKGGLSFRYQDLREEISFSDNALQRTFDGVYQRLDKIPGIFAENIFSKGKNSLILGLRADKHPEHPWAWTPRAMFRHDLDSRTILRASLGRGWRMVNLFPENINLLAGSREIKFEEMLNPERAWNMGINMVHNIEWGALRGYFTTDFYHTRFQNQFFPDFDTNAELAIIKNFEGISISNGAQAELSLRFKELMEWKASVIFMEVYRMEDNQKNELPFNPRGRLVFTFSWTPNSGKWRFDSNFHGYGTQRLPFTGNNPPEFRLPDRSPAFATWNFQISRNWKALEAYAGVENVFDYRQERPILNWQNPFDRYFDTSFVWGPTRGREVYLGLRFYIKRKNAAI